MDARLVWDTWRKILSSDDLVDWVTQPGGSAPDAVANLSPGERSVLADYKSTPKETATNVNMYRQGLLRNTYGVLSHVPYTRQLLYGGLLDVDDAVEGFVEHSGYLDYGPNFWRQAADVVAYLKLRPEFAADAYQDVLRLDGASAALARRLAESPVQIWPRDAAAALSTRVGSLADQSSRYLASPAAVVVSTTHDLTEWIENPDEFDPLAELPRSSRHWLIYVPAADADRDYAELSERAARAFGALSEPGTVGDLSDRVAGTLGTVAPQVLDSLLRLGVVFSVVPAESIGELQPVLGTESRH